MSGGTLEPQQQKGQHQVVTFIFAGQLDKDKVDEWNRQIRDLKVLFQDKMMGVTVWGEKSEAKSPKSRARK